MGFKPIYDRKTFIFIHQFLELSIKNAVARCASAYIFCRMYISWCFFFWSVRNEIDWYATMTISHAWPDIQPHVKAHVMIIDRRIMNIHMCVYETFSSIISYCMKNKIRFLFHTCLFRFFSSNLFITWRAFHIHRKKKQREMIIYIYSSHISMLDVPLRSIDFITVNEMWKEE